MLAYKRSRSAGGRLGSDSGPAAGSAVAHLDRSGRNKVEYVSSNCRLHREADGCLEATDDEDTVAPDGGVLGKLGPLSTIELIQKRYKNTIKGRIQLCRVGIRKLSEAYPLAQLKIPILIIKPGPRVVIMKKAMFFRLTESRQYRFVSCTRTASVTEGLLWPAIMAVPW